MNGGNPEDIEFGSFQRGFELLGVNCSTIRNMEGNKNYFKLAGVLSY